MFTCLKAQAEMIFVLVFVMPGIKASHPSENVSFSLMEEYIYRNSINYKTNAKALTG